jgi:uncharacterized protein (TIGR00369 family)
MESAAVRTVAMRVRGVSPGGQPKMRMEPQDAGYESRVRDSFARQTFMATLGARLASVAPGEIAIELPVRDALTQQHGSVHAGAITSVLDSAAGYAAFSLMPAGAAVVSVEFKVNLLEPARGERIVARGRVIRPGRTLFVCVSEAWAYTGERETLVAALQGTMMCLVGRGVSG